MNNQINIAEILIVNGAGVFCLLYLAGTRLSNKLGKRVGEYLFNCMIAISIVALLLEILSFLQKVQSCFVLMVYREKLFASRNMFQIRCCFQQQH